MKISRRTAAKALLAGAAGGLALPDRVRATEALANDAARERLTTQVCVVGVRETRRILGDYVLSEHDCLAGAKNQKHADVVAITDHAVDIHGRKGRLSRSPTARTVCLTGACCRVGWTTCTLPAARPASRTSPRRVAGFAAR